MMGKAPSSLLATTPKGERNENLQKRSYIYTNFIHLFTYHRYDTWIILYILYALLLFSHCCIWLFVTPWTAACQASLSFTISQSLLRLMSIESMMPSNHLVLCHLLLLLPLMFSSIRVFSNESSLCIKWPKYWSFRISPSNEYSGLIYYMHI